MSYWTYVTGIIEVDTYANTDAEAIYLVQTVVNHLPKVTGSESDMTAIVVPLPGHNVSCSHDEFTQWSNLGKGYYNLFEAQTRAMIVLTGNLRDRMFPETLREVTKYLTRLSKRLSISDMAVKVSGYGSSFVFTDENSVFSDMYEYPENWTDKIRPNYMFNYEEDN